MANCFKPESWTHGEELQLIEMQQRRARVLEQRRKPVDKIAMNITQHGVNPEAIASHLISYADQIRDALAQDDYEIVCAAIRALGGNP